MADRTAGHTFTRTKYPWADWTNGDQWRIYRGEDYRITTFNMQIYLHGRAGSQGLKVKTNSFRESKHGPWTPIEVEGLVFQFFEEEN